MWLWLKALAVATPAAATSSLVQDTMKPHTTYCAIKLKPETVYRFMIISLAQSPLDSK